MALLVAITGIVATMPYIALQLVGISAILKSIGFTGSGLAGELPLLIAFVVLALYTYNSGLRAPALIAFVKDALIYLTIIVAVIVIPSKLGGWGNIFGAAQAKFSANGGPGVLLPATGQLGLRDAGARLGAGAVPVPALDHRRPGGEQPGRAQAEHERAAGLQPGARPDRAAGLHGDRGRHQADRHTPDGNTIVPELFQQSSRAGSPASRSRPSRSARWCPRRSCRSRRRTCSPATSTRSS